MVSNRFAAGFRGKDGRQNHFYPVNFGPKRKVYFSVLSDRGEIHAFRSTKEKHSFVPNPEESCFGLYCV